MNVRAQIALLTCFLGLAVAGCNRVEPIGHYQTPKEDALRHLTGEQDQRELPSEPTDRIVAAIIPRGEQAWVFRLTGPVDPVGKQLTPFKQLVQSTHFESDGAPKWTLPAGWTEEPQAGLRYATITIPSDGGPPLDLSVSVLPGSSEADFDAYLLANVNRWRRQLQLPPLPPLRLHDEIEELKTETFTAPLVDISGHRAETDGMSSGPFAPRASPRGMPAPNSPTSHAPGSDSPAPAESKPTKPTKTTPISPAPTGPAPTGPAPPPTSGEAPAKAAPAEDASPAPASESPSSKTP